MAMMADDSEDNPTAVDVGALVEQYLDGQLTPEQQSALFERLRTDSQSQTLFVRSLMQAAYLNELLAQQRSDLAGSAGGQPAATGAAGRPATDVSTAVPIDLTGGSDSSATVFGLTQIQAWITGWRGWGLVAVGLVVLSGVLLFERGDDAKLANRPSGPSVTGRAAASEVFDPRSIHLDAGSARVTLPKVGYMLVDGPADVEMTAPLRARLNRGRIRVRVTEPSGHGFVVQTPDGDVVDLSTEFGLDVAEGRKTGVVVFDGTVDLRLGKPEAGGETRVERLTGGEGVTFNRLGELERVVSIVTGGVATFRSEDEAAANPRNAVIVKVSDNLRSEDTKKFYEIVPGGFGEEALAYVDRPAHEWNGVTEEGIPRFLVGADYVKTFSDDKVRADMTINVWLNRPATLYVLYDGRLRPPKWLTSRFRKVKDIVGMDLAPWPTIRRPVEHGVGPGESIDHRFTIWERVVKKPGVVALGGNGTLDLRGRRSLTPYMYAGAAVALDSANTQQEEASSQQRTASSH